MSYFKFEEMYRKVQGITTLGPRREKSTPRLNKKSEGLEENQGIGPVRYHGGLKVCHTKEKDPEKEYREGKFGSLEFNLWVLRRGSDLIYRDMDDGIMGSG